MKNGPLDLRLNLKVCLSYHMRRIASIITWSNMNHYFSDKIAKFFIFAMVAGLLANFIVLYVSGCELMQKRKRVVSTYFVLSLCVSDTFQLLLLPFKIDARYYENCWRAGAIGCHIHQCFTNLNLFVSIQSSNKISEYNHPTPRAAATLN